MALAWEGISGSASGRPITQVQMELVAEPSREMKPTTLLKKDISSPDRGGATPHGGPGPSPNDPPFGGEVPVFDSPDNQQRPDMVRDSNDYLYTVFEHDEGGNTDIYLSKSTDGGETWSSTPIANSANNEGCPSIAVDYSTSLGTEMFYIFYEADELEFAWSNDGVNWNIEDLGGGHTFWQYLGCPYVVVKDDLVVMVAERYDQSTGRDTWYILYSLDNYQTGQRGYYFNMFPGVSIYRPRVTIMDSDEILVAMVVRDDAGSYYDALLVPGTLTGSMVTDSWPRWDWMSFLENDDYTNPVVKANGREVIFSMEVFTPAQGPLPTRMLLCVWTSNYQAGSTSWNPCLGPEGYLAFHPTKNQRNPMFYRSGSGIYATWVNGTDINYRYSLDGGSTWLGEPGTGLPLKVNQAAVGTAYLAWHSPDITLVGGRPAIVWHDTRQNGSVYLSTISDKVWYEIDVDPRFSDVFVREVGDLAWHSPPYSYRWKIGTNHTIETLNSYQVPGGPLLDFCSWSDGNTSNPHTITVPASSPNITAYFCCPDSSLTVETSPAGLLVEVNDIQYTSPAIFCCNDSDAVKLDAPSPQPAGPSQGYYFSHWSDAGAQMHNITVTGNITVTAFFNLLSNQPPVANAGGPYFGRKNFVVNFSGENSFDPDGTIVSYEWDFGDGTPHAFGMNVSHTYYVGGALDLVLNVTDDNGSVSSDITISAINDFAPGEPAVLDAVLTGAVQGDVEITWTLSPDDGGIEDDVVVYEIYYGTSFDPGGVGYSLLNSKPRGSMSYLHSGGGHGDPNTYFYQVCAVDDRLQKTCASQQASKFTRLLSQGMESLSIPLILSNTNTDVVFQTVSYTRLIHYDATAIPGENWVYLDTRKPYGGIDKINRTMALWVEMPSDSWFAIAGLIPSQTTIHLVKGWNFVGFPSFSSTYSVADLKLSIGAQRVEGFEYGPNPYNLKFLGDFDTLVPGYGYWILMDAEATWIVYPS